MFSPDDTIVAVATAPGRGAIGVVRISGPSALCVAQRIVAGSPAFEPRRATVRAIEGVSSEGGASLMDEAVVTWFPGPDSYTGQDVVEISAHGSPAVLEAIIRNAVLSGARPAHRGEFTLRSFLNGRRDLVQAEAVADLVDASTGLQAETAFDQLQGTLTEHVERLDARLLDLLAQLEASLDFPDEGHHFITVDETVVRLDSVIADITSLLTDGARGRVIREGATVAIVGRTNVGKSSVFNHLCGSDRAIVTAVPGTTRDLVTERVELGGLTITLVDTAGARLTADVVEREGVERGVRARGVADVVLVVLDGSQPLQDEDRAVLEETSELRRLVVVNKCDLPSAVGDCYVPSPSVRFSALTGAGADDLCAQLTTRLVGQAVREPVAVSNIRHMDLLVAARRRLSDALQASQAAASEEFVVSDIHAARRDLRAILGDGLGEDVLSAIFERFCIGK